jgi:hypothetical protein
VVQGRRGTEAAEAPRWQGATTENTRLYSSEEQRSQRECIGGRMQSALRHGLLGSGQPASTPAERRSAPAQADLPSVTPRPRPRRRNPWRCSPCSRRTGMNAARGLPEAFRLRLTTETRRRHRRTELASVRENATGDPRQQAPARWRETGGVQLGSSRRANPQNRTARVPQPPTRRHQRSRAMRDGPAAA